MKIRTYDLPGAYVQCAVHPDSSDFDSILVAVPGKGRRGCVQDEGSAVWKCSVCTFIFASWAHCSF